jgi:hypothetical protein
VPAGGQVGVAPPLQRGQPGLFQPRDVGGREGHFVQLAQGRAPLQRQCLPQEVRRSTASSARGLAPPITVAPASERTVSGSRISNSISRRADSTAPRSALKPPLLSRWDPVETRSSHHRGMRTSPLLGVTAATPLVRTAPVRAGASDEPPYYTTLGDPVAVGAQPIHADPLGTEGYVDRLYTKLRRDRPHLRLAKLGCTGERLRSVIESSLLPPSPSCGPAELRLALRRAGECAQRAGKASDAARRARSSSPPAGSRARLSNQVAGKWKIADL